MSQIWCVCLSRLKLLKMHHCAVELPSPGLDKVILLDYSIQKWQAISWPMDRSPPGFFRVMKWRIFDQTKPFSLLWKHIFDLETLCSAEAVELWKWSCSQSHKSPLLLQYQQKVQNTSPPWPFSFTYSRGFQSTFSRKNHDL